MVQAERAAVVVVADVVHPGLSADCGRAGRLVLRKTHSAFASRLGESGYEELLRCGSAAVR